MIGSWIRGREILDVPCTLEIEHTPESLHAHVELDGVEVGPGDEVVVQGDPVRIPFGEKMVLRRRATVRRAGWLERRLTPLAGYLELTELFEVGFSAGRRS